MRNIFNLLLSSVFLLFITSCHQTEEFNVIFKDVPLKDITLNTVNLLNEVNTINSVASKFNIMSSDVGNTCDFPAPYAHTIPTLFNVIFIDENNQLTKFTDIPEGTHTFTIPAKEYKVIVTNYDYNTYNEWFPEYTIDLILFGETSTYIDFATVDNVEVEVSTEYSAVMLVNNNVLDDTPSPKFNGEEFLQVTNYYLIYSRVGNKTVGYYTNGNYQSFNTPSTFLSNKVYRYLLCDKTGLTIDIEDDILIELIDTKL